jgi:nitrate reductase delta subunit
MKTFKLLGLLLSYPQPDWLLHVGSFRAILEEERLLPGKSLAGTLAFIDTLESSDLYQLQEDYVATFDRGRAHCLHLFEHIHGESRDRGQAMVNLAATYADKGLVIDRAELPDYLPLFLEFLSCCAPGEAIDLLAEPVEVIAAIGQRLKEKGSPYSAVFEALVALSRARPRQDWMNALLASTPAEDSLAALDREWEEAAAFGALPEPQDCGGCSARQDGLHVKVTR